jgi:hypothetical protein
VSGSEGAVVDDSYVPPQLGRDACHWRDIRAAPTDDKPDGRHHNFERHFDCADLAHESMPSGGTRLCDVLRRFSQNGPCSPFANRLNVTAAEKCM